MIIKTVYLKTLSQSNGLQNTELLALFIDDFQLYYLFQYDAGCQEGE
jgi:hypothetical protein